MTKSKRHIKQATIFETIGTPKGYDDLSAWQKHSMRHDARRAYDVQVNKGHNHKWAAHIAFEQAKPSAEFYTEQNRHAEINKRCGAKAKSTGSPCRMKPVKGKERCKYHGGLSTGPRTLEGRIRSLQGLIQYKRRPDLLEARIAKLLADSDMWPQNYAPQGYNAGEALPASLSARTGD